MRSRSRPWTTVVILACTLSVLTGYGTARESVAGPTLDAATYEGLRSDEFMATWLMLGPIPVFQSQANSGDLDAQKKSFDAVPFSLADFQPRVVVDAKEYLWSVQHSQSDLINLVQTLGPKEYVAAYAWAQVNMPREESVFLGLGSDDAVRVWLNGELVHENWTQRGVTPDSDLVPITLKKGPNQLVLKIQNGQAGWSFTCRMLGPQSLAKSLVAAAGQGQMETLKLLLRHGVDVNARVGPGLTALHTAKMRGQKEAAEFLLKSGADPNLPMPAREKIVDMIFRQTIRDDSPGAAVAVIRNGSLAYENGYGSANLEYGIPITPATVFHVASVSKQFTAFAIVLLAQEGKLSLDDDIRKHLPEMPDFGKTITIRHLIHHTSGLRDQWELLAMAGWRLDDVITKEHILKMVRHEKELNFEPGQEHLYCNTGYTLLAEIVERVSGQSFREYTQSHIFQPLNMADTHFHDDHERIVKNRAYSYSPAGDGGFKASVLSYANAGATSLFTTVEDLAKWMRNFEDGRVGGPAAIEQMQQPGVLNTGKKLDYAFGLAFGKYRGLKTIEHGGADAGYRSEVIWFPEQRLGVTVLSNLGSMNPGDLARQVAEVYLMDQLEPQPVASQKTEPAPVQVDPKVYDEYAGKYGLPGVTISITKESDRLMGEVTGQPKFELLAESSTAFLIKGETPPIRLTFGRGEAGRAIRLTVNQNGQDFTAERVEGVLPAPDQLGEFAGDYYSEELGTTYTFAVLGDRLVAQHRRHDDIPLTPTQKDGFHGDAWWFQQVSFQRDPNGNVTGFRLTGGRVRNLWFERLSQSSSTK
jgi:CubicO group peptidase (beta-lactamase class C family)